MNRPWGARHWRWRYRPGLVFWSSLKSKLVKLTKEILHLWNRSFDAAAIAQILLGENGSSGNSRSFGLLRLHLLLFRCILAQVQECWCEELWLLVLFWFLNDFHLDLVKGWAKGNQKEKCVISYLSRALQASQYHRGPGVMKSYLVNLEKLNINESWTMDIMLKL